MTTGASIEIRDIKEGDVFTLSSDVKNPRGDGRHKLDWTKKKVWAKGARLVVVAWWGTREDSPLLMLSNGNSMRTLSIYDNERCVEFAALWPYLERVEPTVREVAKTHYANVEGMIELMVSDGLLTMGQVVAYAKKEGGLLK